MRMFTTDPRCTVVFNGRFKNSDQITMNLTIMEWMRLHGITSRWTLSCQFLSGQMLPRSMQDCPVFIVVMFAYNSKMFRAKNSKDLRKMHNCLYPIILLQSASKTKDCGIALSHFQRSGQ